MRPRRKPRGFTLIELMVVVTIIGIMAGILLIAVMASRASARQMSCKNNLKQLASGLIQFETTHGAFPNAGTFEEYPAASQANPSGSSPSIIWSAITNPAGVSTADRNRFLSNWVVDILPYIDQKEASDGWDRLLPYFSTIPGQPGQPGNASISGIAISTLVCPDDGTAPKGTGNLSYVVNGGFSLWHAVPMSWTAPQGDLDPMGGPGDQRNTGKGDVLTWSPAAANWVNNKNVAQQMGMMFLGTRTGRYPWDIKSTNARILDGVSNTVLLGENLLAGYSTGTKYSGMLPTNWATPLPSFCMLIGSDAVCDGGGCLGGQLQPVAGTKDGPGWARANLIGTFANINYGATAGLGTTGSSPYASSAHPNGSNFAFCDGSVKLISPNINGTVYSKIITPAGSRLPVFTLKQMLLDSSEIQ